MKIDFLHPEDCGTAPASASRSGSASESVSQRYGSEDPDPHPDQYQNFLLPPNIVDFTSFKTGCNRIVNFELMLLPLCCRLASVKCPSGLAFDLERQTCDWKAKVSKNLGFFSRQEVN
jgi:hypothetical protein